MAPEPISWPPSQYWDGDDGSWSSFALHIGNPPQVCRILPSTAGQETLVATTAGCPLDEPGADPSLSCEESRGSLFDYNKSETWRPLGNYSLGLATNLGYADSGTYGNDTIALGFTDSNGGASLDSQIVAGIETYNFYVGSFGLGNQGTNLTNFTNPHPSFLATLKAKNLIPSMSWAYTAGASYRSKGLFGSLTFGGYDISRFHPNNVSFTFALDISRDLVVALQSIKTSKTHEQTTQPQQLLQAPLFTFIDSTFPYIYLPLESCVLFEDAFGISWNDTDQMYWVNETTHQNLLTMNPNITFTIGNTLRGGSTVDIDLPYASFDLEAKYPLALENTRYFPLQRAKNQTQYTLGRTFLQEAYLITDYERSNFSVSQCNFEEGLPQKLITIPSTTDSPSGNRRILIVGASAGAVSALAFAVLVIWSIVGRRRARIKKLNRSSSHSSTVEDHKTPTFYSVREIGNNSLCGPFRELDDSGKLELLDETSPSGSGHKILEMLQPVPDVAHELATHHSSKVSPHPGEKAVGECKIIKSTQIMRESWTDFGSSNRFPCVQTFISASDQANSSEIDLSTPATTIDAQESPLSVPRSAESALNISVTNASSRGAKVLKRLDLDRSLPPTPISESPQVSLSSRTGSRSTSLYRDYGSRKLGDRVLPPTQTLTRVLASKFAAITTSPTGPLSDISLNGMEKTVPPAPSCMDEADVSAFTYEERVVNTTWL